MNNITTHQTLPSYHFEGKIVVTDHQDYVQEYLDFPFEVPERVGALRLCLQYSPLITGEIANLITLGLFDPHGFRGNAHRHPPDGQIILSPVLTSPGFLPGPIQAGPWLVQLAVQAVVASQPPCTYSLDIELAPAAEARRVDLTEAPSVRPAVVPIKAGWYRGELHSHTLHSDGALTTAELIAEAVRHRLDFLAITDHNTTSALVQIDQAALGGLLVIPGLELTTFYGHALALGIHEWVDWRTGYQGWTMEEAARRTHELGGLFIIAHPNDVGTPICTGCHWDSTDFDLDLVDGIEIWNGAWRNPGTGNAQNLDWWERLQKGERRITATCGSDYHEAGGWGAGTPTIYVYAASLSAIELLSGVRNGRVVLSSGPRLNLRISAEDSKSPVGIGDTLFTRSGRVRLDLTWEDVSAGSRLQVHSTLGVKVDEAIAVTGSLNRWLDIPSPEHLWVEVFTADGSLSALTNPVTIS